MNKDEIEEIKKHCLNKGDDTKNTFYRIHVSIQPLNEERLITKLNNKYYYIEWNNIKKDYDVFEISENIKNRIIFIYTNIENSYNELYRIKDAIELYNE